MGPNQKLLISRGIPVKFDVSRGSHTQKKTVRNWLGTWMKGDRHENNDSLGIVQVYKQTWESR
jgi:hypothetical protein